MVTRTQLGDSPTDAHCERAALQQTALHAAHTYTQSPPCSRSHSRSRSRTHVQEQEAHSPDQAPGRQGGSLPKIPHLPHVLPGHSSGPNSTDPPRQPLPPACPQTQISHPFLSPSMGRAGTGCRGLRRDSSPQGPSAAARGSPVATVGHLAVQLPQGGSGALALVSHTSGASPGDLASASSHYSQSQSDLGALPTRPLLPSQRPSHQDSQCLVQRKSFLKR